MHATDFIQESNITHDSAMVVLTLAWATGASKYAAFASGR